MRRLRIDDLPWDDWSSPSGKVGGYGRHISEALGDCRELVPGIGPVPFDLELARLPAGRPAAPFHSHSAQWELFWILTGEGEVRYGGNQRRQIQPGDLLLHPPGTPHQLINHGTRELTYFLVADNPLTDICHYPDSNKWGLKPPRVFLPHQPVPYWTGEDDGAADDATQPAVTLPITGETLTRFGRVEDIPWNERRSPSGRYHSFCRDLSLALGGQRNLGAAAGGHPFDLQIRRVPAGAAICPFHSHAAQWELFLVLRGSGFVRSGSAREAIRAGDALLHPPGTPHQTIAGDEELECLIIADNPAADIFHYPDSDKWGFRPGGKYFRITEADYFDGEE